MVILLSLLEKNQLIKKKFIKPFNNLKAKLVLTNKTCNPIFRKKYQDDTYLGSFVLKADNK
jgi:hypothetical protein